MLNLQLDLARVPVVYELEQLTKSIRGCVGGLGVMSGVRGVVWRKEGGRGGLMPEIAWAWLRPSHGMGKGALWELGRGGMGLGSSPVADCSVLEGPKVFKGQRGGSKHYANNSTSPLLVSLSSHAQLPPNQQE